MFQNALLGKGNEKIDLQIKILWQCKHNECEIKWNEMTEKQSYNDTQCNNWSISKYSDSKNPTTSNNKNNVVNFPFEIKLWWIRIVKLFEQW